MYGEIQLMVEEKQIKRMVSFIELEAKEKEEEIETKTTEMVSFYKAQTFLQEKQKIDKEFLEKQRKLINNTKLLKNKENHIAKLQLFQILFDAIYEIKMELMEDLANICQYSSKYPSLFKSLILQGLCTLLEDQVILQVRKRDVGLVKLMLSEIRKLYFSISKHKTRIDIDEINFLPSEELGGAIIRSKDERKFVINTVKSRINTIYDQKIPFIMQKMFGSRKREEIIRL